MINRRGFLSLVPKAVAVTSLPLIATRGFAQEAGLSAKAVRISCSGATTGPLGGFGLDLAQGVKAAMTQINAKGGVNGRELQFNMMDDAYQSARTMDNVKKMLGDGSTFALMSCMGTPNNAEVIPLIDAANVPYLAPLTGASSLRKDNLRNVFHVRASYTDEAERLVSKLINMTITNIAIVYLDNSFGKEVLKDASAALAAQNVRPAAQIALAVDGKNLPEVLAKLEAAKPAAVLLGTAGAASTALIRGIRERSPIMPIAGLSVALSSAGVKELASRAQGMALTTVFPDPVRSSSVLTRNYQAAMQAVGSSEYTYGSLESYVNTLVLAEALERAGRDLTRAKLRNALAGIKALDLGGFNVGFQSAPYVGSKFVGLGVLNSYGRLLS